MRDKPVVCEHHDTRLYTLRSASLVDGAVRETSYKFCRYCAGSLPITCPNCDYQVMIIGLHSDTKVMVDSVVDKLNCPKCGNTLAEPTSRPGS